MYSSERGVSQERLISLKGLMVSPQKPQTDPDRIARARQLRQSMTPLNADSGHCCDGTGSAFAFAASTQLAHMLLTSIAMPIV